MIPVAGVGNIRVEMSGRDIERKIRKLVRSSAHLRQAHNK